MERNRVNTIYGEKYTKSLRPDDMPIASSSMLNKSDVNATLDKFQGMANEWSIAEPVRICMAVGLKAIGRCLPGCWRSLVKASRGGLIKTIPHQQALCDDVPMDDVFAAGDCCEHEGLTLPKNSFPAEDMVSIACHNVGVTHDSKGRMTKGGCFGFLCRLRTTRRTPGDRDMRLCAASLCSPRDATFAGG